MGNLGFFIGEFGFEGIEQALLAALMKVWPLDSVRGVQITDLQWMFRSPHNSHNTCSSTHGPNVWTAK